MNVFVYLSSSPPNLRTIFRKEKTVPNTSLASSSVVRADCPKTEVIPILEAGVSDVGLEDLPTTEAGRGNQRRL